ncbi:MAG: PglZ domain-containing protein [candidate division KSB1 bacterium]|nr:PglZ domain-containing protein [candidate division KSB1 bacterium]
MKATEVGYVRGLGDVSGSQKDGKMAQVLELLAQSKIRTIGLVVDKVDKIMHGMELGTAGMHNQIKQWGKQGFMLNLFNLLFDRGFEIYLSSDHGNVEAMGCGRPTEGAVADLRGERVRIYSDPVLMKRVKNKFVNSIEWPPIGLPEKYYALIADGRYAFTQKNRSIVCHGGISMEEVLVPFVKITRENSKKCKK